MDASERQECIARYDGGYEAVAAALAGITPAEWDVREAPGEWSPREIVHHLADAEMTAAVRLRLLIAEERPTIIAFDQRALVDNLFPQRDPAPSLEAFRAARAATLPILQQLTAEQWQRGGVHTEAGPFTAEDWLRLTSVHAHDHAAQIRRARATAQP
ncbi:MAG: DinB family protein [Thermomicrobiales bacterium]